MAPSRATAIRPRAGSDNDSSDHDSVTSVDIHASDQEEEGPRHGESKSPSELEKDSPESLKEISFGALAEAQERFSSNTRKRKSGDFDHLADEKQPLKRLRENDSNNRETTHRQHTVLARSSKHAPTAMSSRNPVSRKRVIFSPPPSAKSRDPRFDATVLADARRGNTSSAQVSRQNYAFLSEYQAAEVLDLKTKLQKAKDPETQAQLKRQVMSLEAKLRNAETTKREAEILHEHKRQERQAIKEGRKSTPYFLKPGEIKKRIQQERQDAMGKRARDKSEKRKKKREKTKEARDMPRVRRMPN